MKGWAAVVTLDRAERTRVWWCAGWSLLIVAVTTHPVSGFVGHAHWERVIWMPFTEVPNGQRTLWVDAPLNLALYLPFGFLGRWAWQGRRSAAAAVAGAVVLSAIIELFQVFCHGRVPSTTDVLMNGGGAACGVGLAIARRGSEKGRGRR